MKGKTFLQKQFKCIWERVNLHQMSSSLGFCQKYAGGRFDEYCLTFLRNLKILVKERNLRNLSLNTKGSSEELEGICCNAFQFQMIHEVAQVTTDYKIAIRMLKSS